MSSADKLETATSPERRKFLGQAASAAAATTLLGGCVRKPVEHIMPYAKRPEDLIPGNPMYYATSHNVGGRVLGLLVESQDGRPTRIDGNPLHPMSRGATNATAQAGAFEVYDADRGTTPWYNGEGSNKESFDKALKALEATWGESGGEGLAFLTQHTPSPTYARVLAALKAKYGKAAIYTYDATESDHAAAGSELAGAGRLTPSYNLIAAKVIVTLDADLFGTDGDAVRAMRDFADGRRDPDAGMNRLYTAEAIPTTTGINADHRLRISSGAIGDLLAAIAKGVGANYPLPAKALSGQAATWAAAVAADLKAHAGASVVAVGPRQPAHVHALACLVNQTLNNVGATVDYLPERTLGGGSIQDLGQDLLAGNVTTLVVLGGNPAYDAPAELGFDVLVKQVPTSIVLAFRRNETARLATWYVPMAHYLESWGDLTASDHTVSLQQPLILPIYESHSAIEFAARLAGLEGSGHDLVKATWAAKSGPAKELAEKAERREKAAVEAQKRVEAARKRLEALSGQAPGPAQETPPGGDEPKTGDAADDEKAPAGDAEAKPDAAKPAVVVPAAAAAAAEGQPAADTPPTGDTPAGDTPAGDTPAGDTSAGDTPAGDTPAGDTPAADEFMVEPVEPTPPPVDPRVTAAEKGLENAKRDANAAREQADAARAEADSAAASASARFETNWRKWVHDGVVSSPKPGGKTASFGAAKLAGAWPKEAAAGGFEVNLYLSNGVLDGRLTNCPWILELPDPVTKLVWDNAAYLSPATAEALSISDGDMINVTHDGRRVRTAAWVLKGAADDVVALTLGWGRKGFGRGADGHGFDAYPLRTSATPWFGSGARVSKSSGTHALAPIQDHQDYIEQRPLIRRDSLDAYKANPTFVQDVELFKDNPDTPDVNERLKMDTHLWTEPPMVGQQWGMAIDLNVCTGCAACTIACNAENNIPVVGKEDCLNGRELHWIRIDRYFAGDAADPEVLLQPMGCAQCETAPCENVCPVGATAHSPSGLNDMAYNRCIGTRYCANNCPYKVRRFNYFNYTKRMDDKWGKLLSMSRNPDVTVRFRGVIEKCSYCVQRINEAVIAAKRDGNGVVADGAIVTACQQVCPTRAITFGDITDTNSAVAKAKANPRNYSVLDEINVRPRTTYLARIRNPNKALATS